MDPVRDPQLCAQALAESGPGCHRKPDRLRAQPWLVDAGAQRPGKFPRAETLEDARAQALGDE